MEDLAKIELFIGGRAIATMAEMQTYAYAVPEGQVVPAVITRLIAGEDVDPHELYRGLVAARGSVGGDPSALEILQTVAGRLRKAFPTETS